MVVRVRRVLHILDIEAVKDISLGLAGYTAAITTEYTVVIDPSELKLLPPTRRRTNSLQPQFSLCVVPHTSIEDATTSKVDQGVSKLIHHRKEERMHQSSHGYSLKDHTLMSTLRWICLGLNWKTPKYLFRAIH